VDPNSKVEELPFALISGPKPCEIKFEKLL
jgi:hypothetical protein